MAAATLLSRLGLRKQIFLIALVGAIGFAGFATFYAIAQNRLAGLEQRMQAARDARAALVDARLALSDAAAAVDTFLRAPSDDAVAGRGRAMAAFADALTRLSADPSTPAQDVAHLRSQADAAQQSFARLVAIRREAGFTYELGLQGTLRTAVRQAEAALSEVHDDAMLVLLLQMRRAEKDFMLRLDPRFGADLAERVRQFRARLPASSIPQAAQPALLARIESYERDFGALMRALLALRAEAAALDTAAAQMQRAADEVVAQVNRNLQGLAATESEASSAIALGIYIALGVAAAIVATLGVVIGNAVAGPLVAMAGAMRALAAGDLGAAVPAADRADEIGQMAVAMQVFRANRIEADQRAEAERQETAAKLRRQQSIEALIARFQDQMVEATAILASSSTELDATASSLADSASRTTAQAAGAAAASSQVSAKVEAVAAATEEMSATANEISRQVAQSAELAGQAVTDTDGANEAMRDLATRARAVDAVVAIIGEIAGQTNLLALNATIEAARAGDAGKGFAIVASEVKALANRTTRATEDIARQITAMQAATGTALTRIEGIGTTIASLSQIAAAVAAAVEEQGVATQDIARNLVEASRGTADVTSSIGGVRAVADETGLAADHVQAASGQVAKQGQRLRSHVDGFIAGIQAA